MITGSMRVGGPPGESVRMRSRLSHASEERRHFRKELITQTEAWPERQGENQKGQLPGHLWKESVSKRMEETSGECRGEAR